MYSCPTVGVPNASPESPLQYATAPSNIPNLAFTLSYPHQHLQKVHRWIEMESERERDPPLPSLELTSTPGVGVYGTGIEGRSSLKAVSIVELVIVA